MDLSPNLVEDDRLEILTPRGLEDCPGQFDDRKGLSGPEVERAAEQALVVHYGDRSVPLPDPLPQLVHEFVSDLRGVLDGGAPPDAGPILRRMAMLETLECAYRVQEPDLVR